MGVLRCTYQKDKYSGNIPLNVINIVCLCVCVCVKKQQRSSRCVNLQHCQFTASITSSLIPPPPFCRSRLILVICMCVCTQHTILYINDTSVLLTPGCAFCVCVNPHISVGRHTHTHASVAYSNQLAMFVCGQGDFSRSSRTEYWDCHNSLSHKHHTYSSCINMYSSAHHTSLLSTNSVSEEHLAYRTSWAVMVAEHLLMELNQNHKPGIVMIFNWIWQFRLLNVSSF